MLTLCKEHMRKNQELYVQCIHTHYNNTDKTDLGKDFRSVIHH